MTSKISKKERKVLYLYVQQVILKYMNEVYFISEEEIDKSDKKFQNAYNRVQLELLQIFDL